MTSTTRARRAGAPRLAGLGFLAPFAIVFALVFLAPIAYALFLSLFADRLVGGVQFVGLENFGSILSDPRFWSGVGNVALFLLVQVPIMLFLSLLVALAIDSGRVHGAAFVRLSIFLPYAVPAVVATLMWGFMYGDRFGLVRGFNELLGTSVSSPLAPDTVLAAIGNIVTWQFVGYNMLIFFAALRTVPASLYEAAEIDGAGELRVVTAIKLPAIRGALVIATIFSIIGSFQLFNEPSILRNLAPNAITSYFTPNLWAYELSFSGQQQGLAAAVAILMGILTAVIAYLVQLRGMRREQR
ncbi:sugar ABC transporter permease [Agrococcus versicolor]|uniref:Sugar ABC transporter permease n=1 Tax=Agrococcus versicolor TaxID=501482 RepID=A0ABN3ARF4_9MICO